jgi:hypothetical protein
MVLRACVDAAHGAAKRETPQIVYVQLIVIG